MVDLRKPDEKEQAIILACHSLFREYGARSAVGIGIRHPVVAFAFGSEVIEDDRGRWTTILGRPVYEVKELEPGAIAVIIASGWEVLNGEVVDSSGLPGLRQEGRGMAR